MPSGVWEEKKILPKLSGAWSVPPEVINLFSSYYHQIHQKTSSCTNTLHFNIASFICGLNKLCLCRSKSDFLASLTCRSQKAAAQMITTCKSQIHLQVLGGSCMCHNYGILFWLVKYVKISKRKWSHVGNCSLSVANLVKGAAINMDHESKLPPADLLYFQNVDIHLTIQLSCQ